MNRCIFCGRELSVLQRKKLHCGGTAQTLCGDCYGIYKTLPAIERAEAALKTGRAEESEKLREYLKPIYEAREQKEAEKQQKRENRQSDKKCLRCGGSMLYYGPLTFNLGEETYVFSDLNRLLSGSLTMDVLRCEACGKTEFFIPDAKELDGLLASEETE